MPREAPHVPKGLFLEICILANLARNLKNQACPQPGNPRIGIFSLTSYFDDAFLNNTSDLEVLLLPYLEARGITSAMTTRKDQDYLNGVPELLILRLLSRQAMYGYELVQTIKVASGETLSFGEGSIYPILHRLEADKLVEGTRETVNGRSRVVYRLTSAGGQRLSDSATRWELVTQAIRLVMQGECDGSPSLA